MDRNRRSLWIACLVSASALGLALAAFLAGEAGAQLRDPPVGWDAWDPGWTQREVWQPDRMDQGLRWRMTRHWVFMQEGVPPAYRGARNPMAGTAEPIQTGGVLYLDKCASCHDAVGTGHGNAGLALHPSPALLAHLIRMPWAVDEYLLWAISEGGEPFATKMPAFKNTLGQDQIWQIIAFMRAGFPATGKAGRE